MLQDFKAQHVILAMPEAAADALKRAADTAVGAGAHVFTAPDIEDLISGKVAINAMRPVDIEDLLGREPVKIDSAHLKDMIGAKTVLITGAGGSIGSELCRQLARFAPPRLVLVEASEFALYNIEQWFRVHKPETQIVPLAGLTLTPPSNTSRCKARSARRPARHRKQSCIYVRVRLSRA